MTQWRCTRCVMPRSRPDVPFNSEGVCQACLNAENRPQIDWAARKAELLALLERHDGRVLVPSSGGKDSHFQALTLKAMGADVVAATSTTCHLTKTGRRNLDNLARHVGGHEYTPNRTVRAKLNRLGLQLVGDISWGEHASIFSLAFQAAIDLKRPLVMMGECPQSHYGGPPGSEQAKQMTHRWIAEYGGFLGLRASDFIGMEGLTERDMAPYAPPSIEETMKAGVEVHFLGAYLPWDSRSNAEFAEAHGMESILPCEANWLRGENADNAQTGLHDFGAVLKFGYGRGCAQISMDIRAGRIGRDDAMAWLKENDCKFPWVYAGVQVGEVLDRIEMTPEQLGEAMERFTDKSLFAGTDNGRPLLKEFA